METQYRGFTITVKESDNQYEVKVTRYDNSFIEHDDNPDYYDDKNDALEHGKTIIDEFLNGN